MEQARSTLGLLLGGLALGFCSALACLAETAPARQVNLYWTDPGTRPAQTPANPAPGADSLIQPFGDAVAPVFGKIDRQRGTLLIPMPAVDGLPKTDAEWAAFTDRLAQGMQSKIQQGLRDGVFSFEIRTAQQAQSARFADAFLGALGKVKLELAQTGQVRVFGLVGGDAAIAAAQSVAALRRSPLDHLVLANGKATVRDTVLASAAMNGQLTLIVTPSGPLSAANSVATLKCAQEAQRKDPRIRLLYLELLAQSASVSANASFDPLAQQDQSVTVKEYTRRGPDAAVEIKDLPRTSMADQIGAVLAGTTQVLIPYGVAMGMKVAPDSFKQDKGGELDKIRKEVIEGRPAKGAVTSPVPEGK